LGDVRGLVVLDFGAGAGRSSEFLRHEGAKHVYAVDHDPAMIERGRSKMEDGIDFILSADAIPLQDEIADACISLNVFVEMSTRPTMLSALREVHRVLRARSHFVVATTSPMAFGHKYLSFEYDQPRNRRSGTGVICHVHTERGELELEDTYWTEEDYASAMRESGFRICSISYPTGARADFPASDESIVAPFMIFDAIRK
jgi:ubiquinone/menaquinone biosynthesis C-methylase UbiE